MKPKTTIGYTGNHLLINPTNKSDTSVIKTMTMLSYTPYTRPKSKGNTKWKQRILNFLKS